MQVKGPLNHTGMASPLELPILIRYRPSGKIAAFNALVHLGALFCLLLAEIPVAIMLLAGTAVLVNCGVCLKRFLSPQDTCIKLDRYDRWQLLRDNGEAVDLELLPGALVHPKIVALCFREPGGRSRYCVLTHGNLDGQTLRRLRVRLRWPR